MSSEKRFMAWKTFEREVPPLNSSRPDSASVEKSLLENPADPEVFFDKGFRYALGEPLDAFNYLLPHGFHGYCPRCDQETMYCFFLTWAGSIRAPELP
jgi:hypothetical protein